VPQEIRRFPDTTVSFHGRCSRPKARLTSDAMSPPVQLDLLPKQNPLVRGMITIHPQVVQARSVRHRHISGIRRLRIDERKVLIRPNSFWLDSRALGIHVIISFTAFG
jgi:hypothetical protein